MEYVHYRGGGAMAPDLLAGRVDFALSSYTASGTQLDAGKLRALAIDADLDPDFAEKWLNFVVAEVIHHHVRIASER